MLTGCELEEERKQAELWRAQAEKNAVTYIKEKYGFEAQVIDSESQKVSDLLFTKKTSKTLVKMEYEGNQFCVLSFGKDEYMDEATDNYQKEELLAAVEDEITSLFGVKPDFLDVRGGDNQLDTDVNSEEFCDMFFRTYYDGTNLEEVLTEDVFYCVAEYIGDIDLDNLYEQNKTSLFEHNFAHLCFVTYDNRKNMELSPINAKIEFKSAIYKHALYVKDALVVNGGEMIPFDMSIGQCDGFYYMNVGADISQYTITKDAEIYDADDWNGHGFANATFVSDTAYYLEGDTRDKLYIYIPEEMYNRIKSGVGDEKVVVASRYLSKKPGDISYNIWINRDVIKGYVVISTTSADAGEFSFRFMYDPKE